MQSREMDPERIAAADVREPDEMRTTTWAEVRLDGLIRNLNVFRSAAPQAQIMAVVKADAYGHGASRVAKELARNGVERFAVATTAEGVRLRQAGIEARILVFAAPLPENLEIYPAHDLDVTVSSRAVAEAVADASSRGDRFRVHVKVDTGMGRIGIRPDEAERVLSILDDAPGVDIEGLWTHLATADEPDLDFAYEQLARFRDVLVRAGDAADCIHAANSAAALRIPDSFSFDRALIRVGIGLYGYTALEGLAEEAGLEPVMRLTSRVTHVKRVEPGTSVSYGRRWTADRSTRIATIAAGYADGYPRIVSNRAQVGIGGTRYPVVGSVCMDMFMVDVGPDSDVGPGDEVVLFGTGGPDAFELGRLAETIPYEILTSVSARVPRRYTGSRV